MVRDGQLVDTDSLSELGIFGFLVRRGDKVISNKQSGHMIRTKVSYIRSNLLEVTSFLRHIQIQYGDQPCSGCPKWQHANQ